MQQFFGKYEVVRELGRGAMGVVYEALDPTLRRRVAVKTIRYDQIDAANLGETLARLKIEAQAGARFTHPNIVGVFDYDESPASATSPGFAYIAMEFVSGKSLKDMFDGGVRLDLLESKRIILQVLNALGHAHQNKVFHRDIKPANIIMLAGGDIKIADFGIARIEDSDLTQVGTVMGTPSYMSPEQFHGVHVDHRTDLYSAGVLLYQMLTGDKPFAGSYAAIMQKVLNEMPMAPSLVNTALDRSWDRILKKALQKNPDDRFQTAQEFAAAIQTGAVEEIDPDATIINAPAPPAAVAGGKRAVERDAPIEETLNLNAAAAVDAASGAATSAAITSAAAGGTSQSTTADVVGSSSSKTLYIVVGVCVSVLLAAGIWGALRGEGAKQTSPAAFAEGGGLEAALLLEFPCAPLRVATNPDGGRQLVGSVDSDAERARLNATLSKQFAALKVNAEKVGVVPSTVCDISREIAEIERDVGTLASSSARVSLSFMGQGPRFSYARKESIPIEVTLPNFASFLYVIYVASDGQSAARLYPAEPSKRVTPSEPSATVLVSDPKDLLGLVASPPAGRDLVIAIASASKVPALEGDAAVSPASLQALMKTWRASSPQKIRVTQRPIDIVGGGP